MQHFNQKRKLIFLVAKKKKKEMEKSDDKLHGFAPWIFTFTICLLQYYISKLASVGVTLEKWFLINGKVEKDRTQVKRIPAKAGYSPSSISQLFRKNWQSVAGLRGNSFLTSH